jgi:hypothetical protein
VKDVAGNALAADLTWTFTTVQPPQVLSTTPMDAATDVPIGVTPKATFSKALDPASVSSKTVTLRDAANKEVPIDISYSPNDFVVAIAPQAPLRSGQTYTVILKGGLVAPRITDRLPTPCWRSTTWPFSVICRLPRRR